MRLYSRTGVTHINDPEYGEFHASEDGSFELPEDLVTKLHSFHIAGKPAWETETEKYERLTAEELERRRDPASLYDKLQELLQAQQAPRRGRPPKP